MFFLNRLRLHRHLHSFPTRRSSDLHAAGAEKVELELRPTQLLIFGNPKLGTPAMTDNQAAGLDLPLRVLAYADGEGVVHVTYHAPATLAQTHALPADAKYIKMMTGALDKRTGKAVAAE